MMGLAWDNPWWLMLLLLAAPLGYVAYRRFVSMTASRRVSAAVARLVLIALLSAGLAGASSVQETNRLAVVAAVDVSASVDRYGGADGQGAAQRIRAFLESAATARDDEDLLGVVAFARGTEPVAAPTRSDIADRPLPQVGSGGTDIAAALRLAAAMIPADSAGRILLLSDGNETQGDALAVAEDLARARLLGEGARGGLPIDVLPIEYRVEREVSVEFVDAPPRTASGATVLVRVGLRATAPAAGVLRLTLNDREVDANGADPGTGRRVLLDAGRSVELVEVELPPGRVHRFRAVFEPEERGGIRADTALENNTGSAFTLSPGDGSVLVVDGVSGAAPDGPGALLGRALSDAGLTAELRPPVGIPSDLIEFEAFDLVILQGVAADEIDRGTQRALATFVSEMGGGLVMVGGPRSFGAGGWRGSPLEPILPLHLDLPQRAVTPEIAIAIVLDSSGSMRRGVLGSARSQQDIANEAAAIAVAALDPSDRVCVVSFNSATQLVLPMGPNDDPDRAAAAIRGIRSGGGTRIAPAMRLAAEQLAAADAKVKHMIVLSDGRAMDADQLAGIAEDIHRDGVTVSTIAVGDGADLGTMEQVADAAQGSYYHVINPNVLPRVFLKEVRVARTPLVREGAITPVVLPAPSAVTAGLTQLPRLGGVNLTRPREDASVTLAMATRRGEPLLAHWNVGVGQVAAFTSDAHEWASRWVDWPGYQRFWGQLARAMSRSVEDSGLDLRVRHEDGLIRTELNAADDDGVPLDLVRGGVTVYGSSGQVGQAALSQVGPGAYEAAVDADEPGSYVLVVRGTQDGRPLPPMLAGVTVSGGSEFRALSSDAGLLRALAEQTGGRVLTPGDAELLFDRGDIGPIEARTPLWRTLLAWALAVLLLDVGTRRVAWDRLLSSAFGADWLRATRGLRQRGSAAGASVGAIRSRGGARATSRVQRTRTAVDVAATDEDAQRIAFEAQQRILRARAERAANQQRREQASPKVERVAPKKDDAAEGGLLAAKRRARKRFEDDG